MLEEIGTPDRAESWLRDAVERGDRLMGFGHRVYKTDDPRSLMLREVADSLAFATRHGFLIKSLRKAISALGQYTRARRSNPLLRLTREQLAHMAHGAGLEPQFLPENLTYRQNRVTARLSLAS